MLYIRKQFATLKERILEPRKFIQVLAGPRQVGKSTLVGTGGVSLEDFFSCDIESFL